MKIAFLLGSPDISGESYVIFEHAKRINRPGHLVSIITEDFGAHPCHHNWWKQNLLRRL